VRARLLIVPAVFAAAAVAHTQPPPPPFIPDVRTQLVPATPSVPAAPPLLPLVAGEKSLEKMLDQLEGLRVRKADLEKQEQELMTEVRKLLEKQDERVKRLGVVSPPLAVPPPPAVVPTGLTLPPYPLPKKN